MLKSLSLRRIVAHMVVGGLAGIAFAMSGVAWFAMRLTLRAHTRSAGEWARLAALSCLGLAAIGAFAGDLLLAGIVVALLVPTAACVLGFAVAVATADGDDGWGGPGSDDEPPWWPSFERQLRSYDRRRVRL